MYNALSILNVGIIGGADGPTVIFIGSDTFSWVTVTLTVLCLLYAGLSIFAVVAEFRKTNGWII